MTKHFELTEEFKINVFGVKVFRIKATIKSKWAEVGELGGFVDNDARVSGNAWVSGDAEIESNNDFCVFQNFGSSNRNTTFFKTKSKEIKVVCGCFLGTLLEFSQKVVSTHGDSKFAKEYLSIVEVVKIKFNL